MLPDLGPGDFLQTGVGVDDKYNFFTIMQRSIRYASYVVSCKSLLFPSSCCLGLPCLRSWLPFALLASWAEGINLNLIFCISRSLMLISWTPRVMYEQDRAIRCIFMHFDVVCGQLYGVSSWKKCYEKSISWAARSWVVMNRHAMSRAGSSLQREQNVIPGTYL